MRLLGTIAGIVLITATQAIASEAGKKVYVARLTEARQCQETATVKLATAVAELEGQGLQVAKAQVGHLNDRMFCSGCDICPEGSFYIALVKSDRDVVALADWEIIDPATIVKSEEPGRFHILPVTDER